MNRTKKRWREILSAIIAVWCILMTALIGLALFAEFVWSFRDPMRSSSADYDSIFSLGDASLLSIWFVVFAGLSVIWFMVRSLEKEE